MMEMTPVHSIRAWVTGHGMLFRVEAGDRKTGYGALAGDIRGGAGGTVTTAFLKCVFGISVRILFAMHFKIITGNSLRIL